MAKVQHYLTLRHDSRGVVRLRMTWEHKRSGSWRMFDRNGNLFIELFTLLKGSFELKDNKVLWLKESDTLRAIVHDTPRSPYALSKSDFTGRARIYRPALAYMQNEWVNWKMSRSL